MFNLYNIVTGAQGGRSLDNLAQQFGVTRDQADNAVKALLPALSTAFMTKVAHPGGMQDLAGALGDDQHKQAYADPGAAQAPETQQKGGDLAGSIFGNSAILQQVIQQASQYSGIPAATLQQMLPVILSIVMGGIATAMHNQGLGGILGQIAGSFGGAGAPAGNFGGLFGNILSGMLGGAQPASAHQPTSQQPTPQSGPTPPPDAAALSPMFQAGMEALSKMFQPGVPPATPGQQTDLSAQISSILGGKR